MDSLVWVEWGDCEPKKYRMCNPPTSRGSPAKLLCFQIALQCAGVWMCIVCVLVCGQREQDRLNTPGWPLLDLVCGITEGAALGCSGWKLSVPASWAAQLCRQECCRVLLPWVLRGARCPQEQSAGRAPRVSRSSSCCTSSWLTALRVWPWWGPWAAPATRACRSLCPLLCLIKG